ncbi:hypothetical protein [Acetobacter estunensis]|uniref:hypothetical protein n=1 Tax=Acetobacter estunensis TaxID=104097 RepID=UPI001C2D1222|nr:hypothetical protein [Acetobacter estunensis]MBV1838335.1 hypothetical protein [Acetobacter estunensis]
MQIAAAGMETTRTSERMTAQDSSSSNGSANVAVSASTPTAASDLPPVNPASHIDPGLGIVVVETYNTAGEVIEQYPTAHMMQQYSLFGFKAS